jgi:hypothetical protein
MYKVITKLKVIWIFSYFLFCRSCIVCILHLGWWSFQLLLNKIYRSACRVSFLYVDCYCSSTICWRDYHFSIILPLLHYQSSGAYAYVVYLWAFHSIPLFNLFVLSPIPHCLGYYSCILRCQSIEFVLFQYCVDCPGSFACPHSF